jgi:hypothetical protein
LTSYRHALPARLASSRPFRNSILDYLSLFSSGRDANGPTPNVIVSDANQKSANDGRGDMVHDDVRSL